MDQNGVNLVGYHSGTMGANVAPPTPSMPVGSFRYDDVFNSRPRVLGTWLVSSSDAHILDQVAELFGGTLPGSPDGGEEPCVITGAMEVEVFLAGPEALNVDWRHQPGHVCDGCVQHDQRGSRPCDCPPNLVDRKIAARAGHGCQPRVRVWFRLQRSPALGTFTFSSGNRELADQARRALPSLCRDPGPTCARLRLQRTPHRLPSGTVVTYTRPTIELLGPADS